MFRRINYIARKLQRRTSGERLLLFEAFFNLGIAWFFVRRIPFKRWSPSLGIVGAESPFDVAAIAQQDIDQVGWSIETVRRYLPWQSTCLMNAAAGKWMLNRRGISSTLYLGVKTALSPQGMNMNAHAWLRAGSHFVAGEEEAKNFSVVGKFATLQRPV